MTPRGRARNERRFGTWLYFYITKFLNRCEPILFLCFCTWVYSSILRDALPGRYSEIFLWLMLVQGVSLGQPKDKVATLIRKLLNTLVVGISDLINSDT